jgi:Fe-S-cluster containining protein
MKIRFFSCELEGIIGYDLEILNSQATIQDYLDGLNRYIEAGEFTRGRSTVKECAGCDGCCAERIPLTNIDIFRLRQIPGVSGNNLTEILSYCAQIDLEPPLVDILLKRDEAGTCIFLYKDAKRCKNYVHRPLVCQTFICCPTTERAQALRSLIVNSGEDELVRLWLMESFLNEKLLTHNNMLTKLKWTDWEENLFTGKVNYDQILIKDLCSEKLWLELSSRGNCHS